MTKTTLHIDQLSDKMHCFDPTTQVAQPPTGWIKAIRTTLGMSLEQLGKKLSITKQSAQQIEKREKEGSITIRSLKEIGKAMDMQLVYGFVPNDGSLDALIERKATELATQIVARASNTMKLEGQENSEKRIEKAIKERAAAIKNEMPKILWD